MERGENWEQGLNVELENPKNSNTMIKNYNNDTELIDVMILIDNNISLSWNKKELNLSKLHKTYWWEIELLSLLHL